MNSVSNEEFFAALDHLSPGIYLESGPVLSIGGVEVKIASKSAATLENTVILFTFHGSLDQEKRVAPFFDHGYAPARDCGSFVTVISVADPSLRFDKKIRITWYAGDAEVDTMHILGSLIDELHRRHEKSRFAFIGQSSGARPALILSHRVRESWCLLVNPLVRLSSIPDQRDQYLKLCRSHHPESQNMLFDQMVSETYRSGHHNWVLVLQNAFDHFFSKSVLPFLADSFARSQRFLLLSNYYEGMLGHDFPWPIYKSWYRAFLSVHPATFEEIVREAMRSSVPVLIGGGAKSFDARDLEISRQIAVAKD